MRMIMLAALGALTLAGCQTTQTVYVPVDANGKPRKLTAAEAKRLRCQEKQQNAANVAMGASIVSAGAGTVSAAAAPHGDWDWYPGWGWGYHERGSYGLSVGSAAVSGVAQVAAQAATNQQIEAAMGNC